MCYETSSQLSWVGFLFLFYLRGEKKNFFTDWLQACLPKFLGSLHKF